LLPFVFLILAVACLIANLALVDATPTDVAKELVRLVAEFAANLKETLKQQKQSLKNHLKQNPLKYIKY
jgi:23S rRNA C2498 (ribose-2'-O)-methylase RlmM